MPGRSKTCFPELEVEPPTGHSRFFMLPSRKQNKVCVLAGVINPDPDRKTGLMRAKRSVVGWNIGNTLQSLLSKPVKMLRASLFKG